MPRTKQFAGFTEFELNKIGYVRLVCAVPGSFAEFDQLLGKLRGAAEARLEILLPKPELINERDDYAVSLAELYDQTKAPQAAHDSVLAPFSSMARW